MTFSKSLADYLARLTGMTVRRVQIFVGRRLPAGSPSGTGAYALVARRKGTILRVSLIQGFAEELADGDSRVLHECTLRILPDAP